MYMYIKCNDFSITCMNQNYFYYKFVIVVLEIFFQTISVYSGMWKKEGPCTFCTCSSDRMVIGNTPYLLHTMYVHFCIISLI